MNANASAPVLPRLVADPMVAEAADRAFADLGEAWWDAERRTDAAATRARRRERLLADVVALGFAEVLPALGPGQGWSDAAAILRAQARRAVPIDMAVLIAGAPPREAIATDTGDFPRGAGLPLPAGIDPARPGPAGTALALGRLLQIGAALEASVDLSIGYARERKQFGRAIGQFQAIQHSLAIAAEEVAACHASTDLALACAVGEGAASARLGALVDVATLVGSAAVDVVYDVAHQVHGAIGFTREYALHRHSLDYQAWREQLIRLRGGDSVCAERVGTAALAGGSLWRHVTGLMRTDDPA